MASRTTLAWALLAAAPFVARASPELSTAVDDLIEEAVAEGRIPGAVVLIADRDQVLHLAAYGLHDVEAGRILAPTAIFRLASLTKPIIAAAAMTLVDEGKLRLDSPLGDYLPAFRKSRKLDPGWFVSLFGWNNRRRLHTFWSYFDAYSATAAERQITVRHLLSHQSGIPDATVPPTVGDMLKVTRQNNGAVTLQDVADGLARVPLHFEPGTNYLYGEGYEVVARLIEVVSQEPLDRFLAARIFEPLRMKDSGFSIRGEAVDRLPVVYENTRDGGLVPSKGFWADGWTRRPFEYFSGGWGLNATADDYGRFCRMMMAGGKLDGVRVLSRTAVDEITTNQTGDHKLWPDLADFGYGFGVRVRLREAAPRRRSSPGSWGWFGHIGTYFWVDPQDQRIAIILTQKLGLERRLEADLQALVREIR